ncbi:MAG TPA: hypothetical protein VGH14_09325 [Solirubrobacterales bacterium]|jgi:hypothetical protein
MPTIPAENSTEIARDPERRKPISYGDVVQIWVSMGGAATLGAAWADTIGAVAGSLFGLFVGLGSKGQLKFVNRRSRGERCRPR